MVDLVKVSNQLNILFEMLLALHFPSRRNMYNMNKSNKQIGIQINQLIYIEADYVKIIFIIYEISIIKCKNKIIYYMLFAERSLHLFLFRLEK